MYDLSENNDSPESEDEFQNRSIEKNKKHNSKKIRNLSDNRGHNKSNHLPSLPVHPIEASIKVGAVSTSHNRGGGSQHVACADENSFCADSSLSDRAMSTLPSLSSTVEIISDHTSEMHQQQTSSKELNHTSHESTDAVKNSSAMPSPKSPLTKPGRLESSNRQVSSASTTSSNRPRSSKRPTSSTSNRSAVSSNGQTSSRIKDDPTSPAIGAYSIKRIPSNSGPSDGVVARTVADGTPVQAGNLFRVSSCLDVSKIDDLDLKRDSTISCDDVRLNMKTQNTRRKPLDFFCIIYSYIIT